MTYEDGRTYTGQWVDIEMHGEGTMEYDNGDKYAGSFTNGRPASPMKIDLSTLSMTEQWLEMTHDSQLAMRYVQLSDERVKIIYQNNSV